MQGRACPHQRFRQDRNRRVRPSPERVRHRDPLDRRHREATRRSGGAGGRSLLVHRIPGDDGGPRQGPCIRGSTEASSRGAIPTRTRCASTRSRASTCWSSTSIRSSARWRGRNCDLATAIENIDVGGPAMLRAAAKNHAWVTVVVDAGDYAAVLEELRTAGAVAPRHPVPPRGPGVRAHRALRRRDRRLPRRAGRHGTLPPAAFPPHPEPPVREGAGDALRREPAPARGVLRRARGRADERGDGEADPGQGALVQQRGRHRRRPGVRQGLRGAGLRDRQACEPVRRRGGGANPRHLRPRVQHRSNLRVRRHHRVQPPARRGDRRGHRRAPVRRGWSSPPASTQRRARRSRRRRTYGCWSAARFPPRRMPRSTSNASAEGCWSRTATSARWLRATWRSSPRRAPTETEMRDLLFAWKVVKFVKSNAIVYCRDGMTIGNRRRRR